MTKASAVRKADIAKHGKPKTNYFKDSGKLRLENKRLREQLEALANENRELKANIHTLIQRR